MILGMVSFMAASLVETICIGWVGTEELAALSFTFPVVMVLQGIAMGLGVGAASVVARSIGAGDKEGVRRVVTHSFLLASLLQIGVAAITYTQVVPLFRLLGAEPHILVLITGYMEIWLLGAPFFAIAFVGSMLLRATGDVRTPGYLMAIGALLHVLIAPIFVFGLGPAPEMGLRGAAMGFLLARVGSLFMYLYCLGYRDRQLTWSVDGMLASWKATLHVGFPAVASNLIAPVSMGIIMRLLASHGAEVVAGYGVASRIESMVMMVVFSLSMSVAPFVGQNWGAGRIDRVQEALRLAIRFCLAWGAMAFVALLLVGESLVAMINDDPQVIEAAAIYLIIVPIGVGFGGVMNTVTQAFNALGKPMPPLVLTVLQTLVVYVPLAIVGNMLWGYKGIFGALALTSTVLGIVSWVWILRMIDAHVAAQGAAAR